MKGSTELHTVWDEVGAVRMRGRVNDRALAGEGRAPHVVLVHGLGMATGYLEPTMRALGNEIAVSALDLPGFGGSRRAVRRGEAGQSRSLDSALRAPLGMTPSHPERAQRVEGSAPLVIPSERSEPVIPSERSNPVIPSEPSESVIPSERSNPVIPSERSESRDPHPTGSTLLNGLADALIEWLRVRDIVAPVLVGQSHGCQVIVDAVSRHPELASALVLNAPTMLAEHRSVIRQLRLVVLDTPREPLSLVPHVVRDYLRAGPLRILATLKDSLRDRLEEKLPAVRVPVTILTGARDPVSPPAWCERLARLAGSKSGTEARLVIVPGAAHAVPFSHPEALAAEIVATVHRLEAMRVDR